MEIISAYQRVHDAKLRVQKPIGVDFGLSIAALFGLVAYHSPFWGQNRWLFASGDAASKSYLEFLFPAPDGCIHRQGDVKLPFAEGCSRST